VTAESSVVSTPHRNVPDISTVPDVIELDTWISLVRMVAEFSISFDVIPCVCTSIASTVFAFNPSVTTVDACTLIVSTPTERMSVTSTVLTRI
jgi:hypothetical protein